MTLLPLIDDASEPAHSGMGWFVRICECDGTLTFMELRSATDLGAAIRRLRRAAGMTQNDLAEAARISRRTLGALESGHPHGEIDVAFRVLHALSQRITIDTSPLPAADGDDLLGHLP